MTQAAPASAAQIATDESAVAAAEAALAAAETAVANATLTAPIDGRITAVNVTVGSNASGVAIELQSTQLAVTASFTEDDILSLQIGQVATVTVSATGATATGRVSKVNPTASGTAGSSVVSYKVTILLDSASASSTFGSAASTGTPVTAATTASPSPSASATTASPLPGMSAEVDVTIAEAQDVVAIPAIALSGTSGSYTVRVLDASGSPVTRSVEVGLVASAVIGALAGWGFAFNPLTLVVSTPFSLIVGVVFGVWPARQRRPGSTRSSPSVPSRKEPCVTASQNPAPAPAPVLPPQLRRGGGGLLLLFGALVAVAGLAFAGGRLAAPATASGSGGSQSGQLPTGSFVSAGSFAPGADGPGGLGAGGSMTVQGTVKEITADTLTITTSAGGTVQVSLAGMRYQAQASTTAADVTVGSEVLVRVSGQQGGAPGAAASAVPAASPGALTMTATDVTVVPK